MNADQTDPVEIVRLAVNIIDDKKGLDIAVFETAQLPSAVADYVIIASGQNAPHLKALVNAVIAQLKKNGVRCYRKSGEPDSGWIIADYLDVMIHFFSLEQREYYNLDRLFEETTRNPSS